MNKEPNMNSDGRFLLSHSMAIACAAALLLSLFSSYSAAQHGPQYLLCLDTLAINSKSVFVGRIVQVHQVAPNSPNDNVTVRVEKWLKGSAQGETIETRIVPSDIVLSLWKDRGSRLLIFTGIDTAKVFHGNGNAIDLSGPNRVLTADMKVLKNSEQILQAAQAAIERYRGISNVPTFQRSLPAGILNDLSLVTAVPVNPDLEHWAQSVLDSEEKRDTTAVGVTSRGSEREEAAQALGYFPSEANAARLKFLLDDPAIETDDRNGTQIYVLRRTAYEALSRMGMKVPKPVFQKEIVPSSPDTRSDPQKQTASLQTVTIVHSSDARTLPGRDAKLAFSDADHLIAIGNSRAILYVPWASIFKNPTPTDAGVMYAVNVVNFDYDTEVRAISSDGRKAILATGVCGNEKKLAFLDTTTGQRKEIPSEWYDLTDSDGVGALSGDGRLLSIYSESGPAESPMAVTVYDWPTKTLVAKRTSEWISAGGSFGGGVTTDGAVEFDNNRVGRKIVDLKTGRLLGKFGYDSARSPDGTWVVEFPDRTWNESLPKDVLIKDGTTGQTRGKLDMQLTDDETWGKSAYVGSFCGNAGRFVSARAQSVALYSILSGNLLANFPVSSWRDPKADEMELPTVACSPTGARVAILSGSRLTFHDLK
jgi:hypothetical protein